MRLFTRHPLWVLVCHVSIAITLFTSTPVRAADDHYLQQLLEKATELKLSQSRQWLRLLHYRPRLLGHGVKSEADDPDFFTSPNGKYDPEAELHSTLKAFFSPAPWRKKDEPAQCAFIARYEWLRSRLDFDPKRLPPQHCDEFERWYAGINPGSITLVFPSAYLNNPSSMFGHTLLRVDTPGQQENTRLLSYVINYGADTGSDNGVAFAVKGIFGGYPGFVGIGPYYKKVKEYSDTQSRDIWEYQLNLTAAELRRLLTHVWELRGIYFDYYFFDENCSYAVLTLLDVARPSLDLSNSFHGWVIPSDTLRRVAARPGLVNKVVYRPAAGTRLSFEADRLPQHARQTAVGLASGRTGISAMLNDTRLKPVQADTLLLASDYLRYQFEAGTIARTTAIERSRQLLLARSKLPVTDDTPQPPVPAVRPEQGHATAMLTAAYGVQDDSRSWQLNLRPAYHDLLDDDGGYVAGAQIDFLNIGVRYRPDSDKASLDHLTLVDIISLSPRNLFFHPVSWQVRTGWKNSIMPGQRDPVRPGYYVEAGGGLAFQPAQHLLPYIFINAAVKDDARLDRNYAFGSGLETGLLAQPIAGWKIRLQAGYIDYFAGDRHHETSLALQQRYSIQRRQAIGLDWRQQQAFGLNKRSLLVSWRWYW